MKVLQILPELNAGGVERGTLEVAAFLVKGGHESLVVSNGGRLVGKLEREGSRHIKMPVHRKSVASFFQVRPLRRLLEREKPDILHIRSRVPGWIAWLAWRKMDPKKRPKLVSTVHGFYSVNVYSEIMTKGERVITVSESAREYVLKNYPKANPKKIRTIHRGVDEAAYYPGWYPSLEWLWHWRESYPQLTDRKVLLMPGRLTRWKGQEDFLEMLARLLKKGAKVHGLIAGEAHARKMEFAQELRDLAEKLGITEHVTFLGHREDLREIMSVSDIVYSFSRDPEAFGRVSLEALALGCPVIGYGHGGVAEQLQVLFPQGLVPPGNIDISVELTLQILENTPRPGPIGVFSLEKMLRSTMEVYQSAIANTAL